MNIYEKLMNIQAELKAPKNQYNSFGKYKYRSCEDILEGVKPLLAQNKTVLVINDDLIQIGDRYYIKAIAKLIDVEKGESIEATALARESENKKGMDAAQVTGSTSSYARKYALNGLFCIDDTKDSDTPQSAPTDTPKQNKRNDDLATGNQKKAIYAKAGNLKFSGDDMKGLMMQLYKKDSSKKLTKAEASDLLQRLSEMEQGVQK